MARALLLAGVAAVVVAATPSAAGSPTRSLPIRIGKGIGPINLGMTGQEVRRALGRPGTVLERRVLRRQPYIELQWGYGNWNVGLLGPKGRRRVVVVGTALSRHRTPEGIGVGSSARQVARAYPDTRERNCWRRNPQSRFPHWFLQHASTETIFIPVKKPGPYDPTPRYEVGAVEVRSEPVLGCVT